MYSVVKCSRYYQPVVRYFCTLRPHVLLSTEIFRSRTFFSNTRTHLCSQFRQKEALDSLVDPFYEAVDYEYLSNGDEELLKKLKILVLEVEVMRQEGMRVPLNLSTEQWKELLELPTRSQQIKHLAFLSLNERKKKKDKEKKEEARRKKSEELQVKGEDAVSNQHIRYGFQGSNIMLRVYDSTIDLALNYRLIQAMMFGQKLVIDCGYDSHMTLKEASNCAKQLAILFSENRKHPFEPFDLHFCNCYAESKVMTKLRKIIPTLYDEVFPLNLNEKSYLDIFPKEKLVYLTPHCREEMKEFNYDDIYIVGAIVDKTNQEPVSLAKAKEEGLRMAKFPLDRYLTWHLGTKSLTINQVISILLDLRESGNWKVALRHVPTRKLRNGDEPDMNRMKFKSKYFQGKGQIMSPSGNKDLRTSAQKFSIRQSLFDD